jgi:hypothetical protein
MNFELFDYDRERTSAASPMDQPKLPSKIIPSLLNPFGLYTPTGTSYFAFESLTSTEPAALVPTYGAALSSAIYDIRRLSGLTWEELAELFSVQRRSVHYWANGGALKPQHDMHVRLVLNAVLQFDRRGAAAARQTLLTPDASGTRPLDLLAQRRYHDAVVLFNSTPKVSTKPTPHPNKALPQPARLMGTLTDRPAGQDEPLIPGRGRRLPKRHP